MSALSIPAFLTGTPGPAEIVVIFLVILVFFGPRRLPGIARGFGKIMEDLRRAAQDFRDQIMGMDDPPPRDASGGAAGKLPEEAPPPGEEPTSAPHDDGIERRYEKGEDDSHDLAG